MRELNDSEKTIVKDIVDKSIERRITSELICNFSKAVLIEWDNECTFLKIHYANDTDVSNILNNLLDILNLLEYLKKNGMLGLYETNDLINKKIYNRYKYSIQGGFIFERTDVGDFLIDLKQKKINSSIGRMINKYANTFYYPTQCLVDYVKNGYKDIETIRYERTRKREWIAIGFAIFIGVASIAIDIFKFIKG